MLSVSRIPTRNNSNTKTALSTKTVNNENLPPASSTNLLQSKVPSSSKVGSTLSATTRASRRIRESSVGQKAKAIEISVQLPSSEGGRCEGTDETNEGIERNSEYSEQESDLKGAQGAVEGDNPGGKAAFSSKNSVSLTFLSSVFYFFLSSLIPCASIRFSYFLSPRKELLDLVPAQNPRRFTLLRNLLTRLSLLEGVRQPLLCDANHSPVRVTTIRYSLRPLSLLPQTLGGLPFVPNLVLQKSSQFPSVHLSILPNSTIVKTETMKKR